MSSMQAFRLQPSSPGTAAQGPRWPYMIVVIMAVSVVITIITAVSALIAEILAIITAVSVRIVIITTVSAIIAPTQCNHWWPVGQWDKLGIEDLDRGPPERTRPTVCAHETSFDLPLLMLLLFCV